MPLVTLERVSLAFGHLPLFESVDLRIDAGERVALIGRNGTGKSSLLKVIDRGTTLDMFDHPSIDISVTDVISVSRI